MRALGHLWLWIGFLAAAFFSVYRLEQKDDKWSTISWDWYALSMFVGIAGIAVLRRAKRHDHSDEAKTEAEFSVIQESLDSIAETIQRLAEQSEHVPADIVHTIDNECVEPLSDFADARQSLVKRFGLSVYAEVMTEFAAAERYINRSWSAAADGYVDEVKASLGRARGHLGKAKDLIRAAEKRE